VTGTGSGIPEWVKGECTGETTCNPTLANTSNPCSQDCTPGAQRCASNTQTGVNDGYEQCDDTGKWGAITSCNPGADTRLLCAVPANPDATQLPKALCVEPVCEYVITNPNVGATGACDGDKLRKCNSDGTIADAAACSVGICRSLRSTATADGRMPGACDATPECQTGEEICATTNDIVTPRYRSCVNGYFGTELQTCDNDAPCYTSTDPMGVRHKLCGAACSPGTRHCNGSGQLETCNDQGQWADAEKCAAGSCRAVGNHDASCVLDCIPASKICAGSAVVAPDAFHAGTAQEATCTSAGVRGPLSDCAAGKSCRVTDSGVVLGCVECVGTQAPGGNDEGTSDTRCDPNDMKKIQDCSDTNAWSTSRSCSGSKNCVSPAAGTCGTCTGSSGATVTCTDADLAADQAGASCTSLGYGAPSAWGTQPDCCANYQLGAGNAASFAYCN
jgi:hypothetical protein